MPVGGTSLPVNMAAAEQAALLRAVNQLQERAMSQAAAGQAQDRGKEDVSEIVRGTQGVEGATIQGESRGAHSFLLAKEEEPQKEELPPAEPLPDPEGRGRNLDLEV